MPGILIVICGLPGAGKTTLARRLCQERKAIRLSPDDLIEAIVASPGDIQERDRLRDPVEAYLLSRAEEWLDLKLTVIVEFGSWSRAERLELLALAHRHEARCEMVYLEAHTWESLWERVQERNRGFATPLWRMSRADLEAAWSLFEAPQPDEASLYDSFSIIPAYKSLN